jgi:diaminohydroxyphosphoribosylaminopyrimidine deaminase / 5-amino-6-(5-phosphoribosylamino)uracil reductase
MNEERWMAAAVALGERGRGRTAPNPNVGCIIVREGIVVGRGWTRPGGRPHAEAEALAQAGEAARGATAYVTLEPCCHESPRGPACADLLIEARVSRVVSALCDPWQPVNGQGLERLRQAGIEVEIGPAAEAAERSMAGFLTRVRLGRPHVKLKLAFSEDGRIARPPGEGQWITGEDARAHVHLERARCDMILVGRGTYEADAPRLDVRLEGLEDRSPRKAMLTRGEAPDGWTRIASPAAISALVGVNDLMVEGGAETADAFMKEDLVDRMILYRAPMTIGSGEDVFARLGLDRLSKKSWRLADCRMLGIDRLEVYERIRS